MDDDSSSKDANAGSKYVDRRVAKYFDNARFVYSGTVTKFIPAHETAAKCDLFEISYDDGDVEDMTLAELNKHLDLHREQIQKDNEDDDDESNDEEGDDDESNEDDDDEEEEEEKDSSQETNTSEPSTQSDEASPVTNRSPPSCSFLNRRVAKVFEDVLVFGTVASFYPGRRGSDDLWHVTYDDGDVDDLIRSDLILELQLYDDNKDQNVSDNDDDDDEDDNDSVASVATSDSSKKRRKQPTDLCDNNHSDNNDGEPAETPFAADRLSRVTPSPDFDSKVNVATGEAASLPAIASLAASSPDAQHLPPRQEDSRSGPAPSSSPATPRPVRPFGSTTNRLRRALLIDSATNVPEPQQCTSAALLANALGAPVAQAFRPSAPPIPAAAAHQKGPPPEELPPEEISEEAAQAILNSEEKQDWKKTQKELDDMFERLSGEKFAGVPDFVLPPGFQEHLELYDYQKDGIRWLVHQERDTDRIPAFWKKSVLGKSRNEWWRCTMTRQWQKTKPEAVPSSILADDMGLGKTLQTIGLILSNAPEEDTPSCTLIVCPVSVISNWKIQIDQFVKPGVLKVGIYQGSKREKELKKVKQGELDVLITSYSTLASDLAKHDEYLAEKEEAKAEMKHKAKKARIDEAREAWNASDDGNDWEPADSDDEDDHFLPASMLKRRRGSIPETWLFDIPFHRICLDEAHIIRNSETGFFKAVMAVPAERKLCLTGTPFVNRPSDIHSLFAFLGAKPLSDKKVFADSIVAPILDRKEIGLARMRTMMSHVALRRTKALVESTIDLVPKEVIIHSVEWPEGFHKDIHDVLYETAREAFIGLLRAGSKHVFRNFYALLTLLLRVRQSCCHGGLVPEKSRKVAEEVRQELEAGIFDIDASKGEALLRKLLGVLQGPDTLSKECPVCFEEMEEASAVALRVCEHSLCSVCLNRVSNERRPMCPMCRQPFEEGDMVTLADARAAAKKKEDSEKKRSRFLLEEGGDFEIAPKVQALLDVINEMKPDEKGVIFSQWTSFLDIIQAGLERSGHAFTRIDGSMNAFARIEAMQDFSSDSEGKPRFILCSLHACGTGINLTRGNVVFMMDCWWNLAAENQAMDRVHRVGQKRPVRAYRLIMKDSIEERMINLQNAKAALGKGSLQKLSPEERKRARITAMKDLFEVGEFAEEWEGVFDDDDDGADLRGFIVDDSVVD